MNNTIKSEPRKNCPVCNTTGNKLYESLKDRLFGVDGKWHIDQCPNAKCGLLWLNPMPKKEELPKLYKNYYTHDENTSKQAKKNWLIQAFNRGGEQYLKSKYGYPYNGKWLDQLVDRVIRLNPEWAAHFNFSVFYLDTKINGKLLEIGCGNGEMLKNMQKRGWQVTGLDFDPKSVFVAKNKGLNILLGSLEEQQFPQNSFDAIVMSHVIEHIPDPIALLQECHRILRPKGKLISITPNTNGYNHKKFKANSRILEPPRHLHLFNKTSLKKVALLAGFNNNNIFTTLRYFSGLHWSSENIKNIGEFSFGMPMPLLHKIKLNTKSMKIAFSKRKKGCEGDELVIIAEKQ